MNSDRLAKHWKIVEVQLNQAAEFLTEPFRFSMKRMELEDYSGFIDSNEFELAMNELADIAHAYGCKSGFWRRQYFFCSPKLQDQTRDPRSRHDWECSILAGNPHSHSRLKRSSKRKALAQSCFTPLV